MTSNKDIQNELSSLSPILAEISNANVFSVPDNYFNELPHSVLQLIKAYIKPSFDHIPQPALSVPEGYFEGLAGNILNRIKSETAESAAEEMAVLSPVIAAIGNRNVFTTPRSYFDHVSTQALDNIAKEAPVKVVTMKKRAGFIRYMAAAAITGVIGLTIFNISGRTGNDAETTQSSVLLAANEIIKNKTFDAELSKISDQDIEQYFAESGQDVNAALVASTIDDVNLPNAEDYIIDDNTLDEFLNKNNLNN